MKLCKIQIVHGFARNVIIFSFPDSCVHDQLNVENQNRFDPLTKGSSSTGRVSTVLEICFRVDRNLHNSTPEIVNFNVNLTLNMSNLWQI